MTLELSQTYPTEQVHICIDPVFIVGSPRSGTTILALSLAEHNDLWTSTESQIMWDLFGDGRLNRNYQREGQLGGSWLQSQHVEKAEFLRFIGLGLNALFTSRSQGKRWIDHTPIYTLMVDDIAQMFPGAFFIHILRDGRDVVRSMINYRNRFIAEQVAVKNESLPSWASDFRTACKTWSHFVETSMAFAMKHPTRCMTVLNEELVASPSDRFAKIYDFIGVDHADEPIEYFCSHRINSSFPRELTCASDASSTARAWNEWTPDQKQIYMEEAGDTSLRYGLTTNDSIGL